MELKERHKLYVRIKPHTQLPPGYTSLYLGVGSNFPRRCSGLLRAILSEAEGQPSSAIIVVADGLHLIIQYLVLMGNSIVVSKTSLPSG